MYVKLNSYSIWSINCHKKELEITVSLAAKESSEMPIWEAICSKLTFPRFISWKGGENMLQQIYGIQTELQQNANKVKLIARTFLRTKPISRRRDVLTSSHAPPKPISLDFSPSPDPDSSFVLEFASCPWSFHSLSPKLLESASATPICKVTLSPFLQPILSFLILFSGNEAGSIEEPSKSLPTACFCSWLSKATLSSGLKFPECLAQKALSSICQENKIKQFQPSSNTLILVVKQQKYILDTSTYTIPDSNLKLAYIIAAKPSPDLKFMFCLPSTKRMECSSAWPCTINCTFKM